MRFDLGKLLKAQLMLVVFLLCGCVFTDTPMLTSADADMVPFREGYYTLFSTPTYLKVQGGRVLLLREAGDEVDQEVVVKALGNGLYLMQKGAVNEGRRMYGLMRFSADGKSAELSFVSCGRDEYATVFMLAGMTPTGSGRECTLRNATPARLFRAYSLIASRFAHALVWDYRLQPDEQPGAAARFEAEAQRRAAAKLQQKP